jgi:hypothetical protein
MDFNLFGNDSIKSPEQLSEHRALVRALMMRQLNQRPRDMWDGINNLVGAVSSRFAQNQLDKIEAEGQAGAEAGFAPLIEALRKKQVPDTATVANALTNPWLNPGQRTVVKDLYKS